MPRTPKGQMAFDDVQLEPDEELIEILGRASAVARQEANGRREVQFEGR